MKGQNSVMTERKSTLKKKSFHDNGNIDGTTRNVAKRTILFDDYNLDFGPIVPSFGTFNIIVHSL